MLTPHQFDSRFMKPTTLCRCGHILDSCSDCRGWLIENSVRIANQREWWHIKVLSHGQAIGSQWGTEAAEADNIAYFESWR